MASCGFVTISDSNYFPGVRALVNSILANSPGPITVIDEGLTREQRNWLAGAGVDTLRVARSIAINDPRFGCCYALFDIDAAPYDRIICIDPDAIVLEDIRSVVALLDEYAIATTSANAFRTLINPGYRRKLRHAFPYPRWHFLSQHPHKLLDLFSSRYSALQSGVVVLRRDLLPSIRKATASYRELFTAFALPDQDLLSLCVADLEVPWAQLPYTMNAPTLHALPSSLVADPRLRRKYEWISNNVESMIANGKLEIAPRGNAGQFEHQSIHVLHYAGPDKPWRPEAMLRPGFRELWRHYHDMPAIRERTPVGEPQRFAFPFAERGYAPSDIPD